MDVLAQGGEEFHEASDGEVGGAVRMGKET